jgi:hypothetical protein
MARAEDSADTTELADRDIWISNARPLPSYFFCRADHFRRASSVYSTCFSGLSDV